MVAGMSAGPPASGEARKRGFGGGQTRSAVRRGGSGTRRECTASSWLSGGTEFGRSAPAGTCTKQLVHGCRVPLRVFSRAGVPYDESIA